ncbi:MAG: BatA and WFA domain-containing protein [Armatimonadaceae bacterium]
MQFLSPLTLLWLLPLAGGIIALYMLRLKRQDVVVPSTLLWAAVLKDTQANAPFQKLRRNLLLLLQLLIAALLVFAVARPFLWASGLGGKTVALVLDASASMKSTDISGGRFAEAVRQARFIIEQKAGGDGVALILAAEKPVLLAPVTTDREKLLRALETAKPTDATHDITESISLAASLIASRAGAQVTVLTDGAFGRLDEMALGGPSLDFVVVGKRASNTGITAFDVRDALGGGVSRQAFVTVQNFSTRPQKVPLAIYVNNRLTDAHELTLKPGESHSETFNSLRADSGGVVEARLDLADDLEADNRAFVTIAPRRTRKVLLVTEGNPFLENALNTDASVALEAVRPADFQIADVAKRDMVVFDEVAPPNNLPPGRYLFWGRATTGGAMVPVSATNAPEADRPAILDWNRTHPVMRFVDLANVSLMRAATVAPEPWATTLAESEAGPLIVAGEKTDLRAVYIGFSLLESDMPLRIAFPIFLTNTIHWLTARPGDSGGTTRPGEVMPLAAPPTLKTLTVTRPDGTTDTVAVTPGAPPLYSNTGNVGLYRATGEGEFEQYFAVSLLSPVESNTAPVEKPSVVVADTATEEAGTPGIAETQPRSRRELWSWLAGIALLILTLEWVFYHRRIG